MKRPTHDQLLTQGEACKKFSIAPSTLVDWIRREEIDTYPTIGGTNLLLPDDVKKCKAKKRKVGRPPNKK